MKARLMNHPNSVRQFDRLHHVHGQTNLRMHEGDGPTAMVIRGHGVRFETDMGQTVIDGFSGLGCVSLGYHNDRLAKVAFSQMQELPYAPSFYGRSHP